MKQIEVVITAFKRGKKQKERREEPCVTQTANVPDGPCDKSFTETVCEALEETLVGARR